MEEVPHHNIFCEDFQLNLKAIIIFEIKSLLGRLFFKRKPPKYNKEVNLLNLGCCSNIYDGWVNADFYPMRFWKLNKAKRLLPLLLN